MSAVLRALRLNAVRRPDAPALRERESIVRYADLHARAVRLAGVFESHGIRVLAIAADNSAHWVIADLAAQVADIAVVPLAPFFSLEQIDHAVRSSGADAMLLDRAGERQVRNLDVEPLAEVASGLALWRIHAAATRAQLPRTTAKVSYTSGSTGRPKGVCLSQDALDRVAASLCGATDQIGIRRHLCLLPLATLLENVAGVYAPLLRGAEIALPSMAQTGLAGATGIDVARLVACLHEERPQSVILLPQMLAGIVREVERGASLPESLRFAAVGGGFVARALLERAERLGLPIYEGYGLTECGSVVALNTPAARRIGSAGRPLAHVAIRIGPDGQIIAGGAAMAGYVGEAESGATEVATGDIGHLDADGFLHIDGRRKNVFITSFGRNVSPDWVEAELTGNRSIAQAAVFGDARPWNVAVIVPAKGSRRDDVERDIAATNKDLPDYARIHRWIAAREPFTVLQGLATANGRNCRDAIWRQYGAEIDACYDESRYARNRG